MLKSLKNYTLGNKPRTWQEQWAEASFRRQCEIILHEVRRKLPIKHASISSFSWSPNKVSKGIKQKIAKINRDKVDERFQQNS